MNNYFVKVNNNGNDITEYLQNLPLVIKGGVFIEKHLKLQKGILIGNSSLNIPGLIRYNNDSLQIFDGEDYKDIWKKYTEEKIEWMLNDKNDLYYTLGKIGINTKNPRKTLDVNGEIISKTIESNKGIFNKGIIIGNTDDEKDGLIKFDNGVFYGFNGNNWEPFNNKFINDLIIENNLIINGDLFVNKISSNNLELDLLKLDFSKKIEIEFKFKNYQIIFNKNNIDFNCSINLNNNLIKNVGNPIEETDIVNKKYVDNLIKNRKFLGIVRSIIKNIDEAEITKLIDFYNENDKILINNKIFIKENDSFKIFLDLSCESFNQFHIINYGFIINDFNNHMLKEGEFVLQKNLINNSIDIIKINDNLEIGIYEEIELLKNKLLTEIRKNREEFNFSLKNKIGEYILDDYFINKFAIKISNPLQLNWNNINDIKILSNHIFDEQILSQHIAKAEIDSFHIKPQIIFGEHLSYNCIEEHHLNDLVIDQRHIKRNIISNEYLMDKCIEERNICDRIINGNMIKMNSIGEDNLMNNIVGIQHIKNGSITESKIMNNSISMLKIQDYSVTEKKIHPNCISSEHIKDRSITNEKIKMPYIIIKLDNQIFDYNKMFKLGFENEIKFKDDFIKIHDGKIIFGKDVVIDGNLTNNTIQKLIERIDKLEKFINK
jgi:hypothetical protein